MDDYPGDEVFDKIEELCDKGEAYMDEGNYRQAMKRFGKAFDLLPEPKTQYPSGTYLLVSIGDIYFTNGNYEKAIVKLREATKYPEGEGNPFLHFRLAQSLFELDQKEQALKEFSQAYEVDGQGIFEDEDEKYWAFFSSNQ